MNATSFLRLKNSISVARWRMSWALQGGDRHIVARDLKDLRRPEDRTRAALIYLDVREAKKYLRHGRQVVRMASYRMKRVRA